MDIKIKENGFRFKFRVAGLVKQNNKYLFVKMGQNDFYCLPGGHVEICESTEQAAKREMEEELDFKVNVDKLLAIHENFFGKPGDRFHELCFYYLTSPQDPNVKTEDYNRTEMDKEGPVELEFRWFSREELNTNPIKPQILYDLIDKDNNYPVHKITKD